jgi:hypothetical protein
MTRRAVQVAVAVGAIAFTAGLLSLQGCALFAPSRDDLMAYCVKDPTVVKRAAELGMTPEELCDKLLRDESTASCDGGDAGACPIR